MTDAWIPNVLAVLILASAAWGQSNPAGLRGTITDPSGASVPAALVQLRGPGGEQRATTDASGRYVFSSLRAGRYLVRVMAKGFTVAQRRDFAVAGPATLDVQLTIEAQAQVINVEDEANKLSMEPDANASALVLGEKELAALSDDPDELEQQLQAMAGPGAGPNGGQIYIDGFSGEREVRINSNLYSTEFDCPGFGRIEIFTRPGTDKIRGHERQEVQRYAERLGAQRPEPRQLRGAEWRPVIAVLRRVSLAGFGPFGAASTYNRKIDVQLRFTF
jgi:Carboxypeptidase regulatory-like domain